MALIPLIDRQDMPENKRHIYDAIAGTRGSVLNVFRSLLNSSDAAEVVSQLGEYIRYRSGLNPSAREIAILATAKENNVPYEWSQHEPIARKVGVRDDVIASIKSGKAPRGLPPKEGIFVQASKELVNDGSLNKTTLDALIHLIGIVQTIDLMVLVGYYSLLGNILKSLEVELDPGVQNTFK